MEESRKGSEMQQNPPALLNLPTNPSSSTAIGLYHNNTSSTSSYSHHSSSSSSSYYFQFQNPIPNNYDPNNYPLNNTLLVQPPPGVVDPALTMAAMSLSGCHHVPSSSGYEPPQLGFVYTHPQTTVGSASAAYYHDPNAAAIPPYVYTTCGEGITIPSTVAQKLLTANTGSILRTKSSNKISVWKKGPKKIKVIQSAWCEICRIDCNSKNVLDQHKMGKKHKKNLEKLIVTNTSMVAPSTISASVPPAVPAVSSRSVIGPQENPDKSKSGVSQNRQKKAAEVKDLETKRKKVVEGGAAVDAVRTCAICNVVCNSETVFRYHLAGQKHAAMMKKHASATGVAAAT